MVVEGVPVGIADERYVSVTTFRASGEGVSTPVWIADLGDGRVGFVTASPTHKVARLRSDPRITLAPCDGRGRVKPGTPTISGVAELVTGPAFEDVRARIARKYSWQYRAMSMFRTVAGMVGKGTEIDAAVIVTLGDREA